MRPLRTGDIVSIGGLLGMLLLTGIVVTASSRLFSVDLLAMQS